MECIIKIKSNEADGQDSSVHSFFYYLLVMILLQIYIYKCR